MGQYYRIVNVDKKEFLAPWTYKCGAKLMEWSYIVRENGEGNDFSGALTNLMQTDWNGDRVYVVGDYADLDDTRDTEKPWWDTLSGLYKEISWLGKKNKDGYKNTLYHCGKHRGWRERTVISACAERYLCNSETKEYIDLRSDDLPEAWTYDENGLKHVVIYPLSLLLAIGNGKGGGDYNGTNREYVGYWVPYSKGIFFSDKIPEGYELLDPGFIET